MSETEKILCTGQNNRDLIPGLFRGFIINSLAVLRYPAKVRQLEAEDEELMEIRKAQLCDLNEIMNVLQDAQREMHREGIPQWINGYPSTEQIRDDITEGNSYVVVEENRIVGTFCLKEEADPYYGKIAGKWLNEEPYAVIHRSAVRTSLRRQHLFHAMVVWSIDKIGHDGIYNLRIDTHEKNMPMRHALEHEGFTFCGVIQIADGTDRFAYQRVLD